MPSSAKTVVGLNLWLGKDKPKREDFNKDNEIISQLLSGSQISVSDFEPISQAIGGLWFDTSD